MCGSLSVSAFVASVCLLAVGIALIVLGSIRECSAEPKLPVWMVAAGVTLAAVSVVSAAYFLAVIMG